VNHTKHYFWAVQLPEDIKENMYREMKRIQPFFPFKKWVYMSDYHITLAFLGSMDEQRQHLVIDLVSNALKDQKAFQLQIQGLHIFGNTKSPRIFWSAVNHENSLFQLQGMVHQKCQEAGFTLETRSYQPHITLARNWIGDQEFDTALLEKWNPFRDQPLSFLANKVVLYRTDIDKIPKYEPIATLSLRS